MDSATTGAGNLDGRDEHELPDPITRRCATSLPMVAVARYDRLRKCETGDKPGTLALRAPSLGIRQTLFVP